MRQILLLIFLFLSFLSFSQAPDRKVQVTQLVFDNLVNAYGSNKSSPTLKILPKGSSKVVAQYIAYPSATIQIDEDLYNICMSFGKDSTNALAIILSHELAHYYNDHSWCSDYAYALNTSTLGKTLIKVSKETKIEKESIADSYGLFYASMAGYQPFEIFNPLLDKIYNYYKLPEIAPGYPSKKERKEINWVQKEKIEELVPVFESGVLMLHLKYYDDAAICFEYLTKCFPSREKYNNLEVCSLFQALDIEPQNTLIFIYPIEFDASSRIYQNRERGSDQDTLVTIQKYRDLMQQAKTSFEKAISLDPSYIRSYINLACLYDIRGNFQASLGTVTEAANLVSGVNSNLQLIKAIALYHDDKKEESGNILAALNNINYGVYNYNYQLFLMTTSSQYDKQEIEKWKDKWVSKNVILSSDTCRMQVKYLTKLLLTNNLSHTLTINDNMAIGRMLASDGSIVSIVTKNFKISANIRIYKSSNLDTAFSQSNIIVNNNTCFTLKLPQFDWQIVYKEFKNE